MSISTKHTNSTIKILTTKHIYYVKTETESTFKENTFYFPGWNVYANNKKVDVNYKNPSMPGIITFKHPKGLYKIEIIFQNSPIRNVGDGISAVAIVLICAIFIYLKVKKNEKNQQIVWPKKIPFSITTNTHLPLFPMFVFLSIHSLFLFFPFHCLDRQETLKQFLIFHRLKMPLKHIF